MTNNFAVNCSSITGAFSSHTQLFPIQYSCCPTRYGLHPPPPPSHTHTPSHPALNAFTASLLTTPPSSAAKVDTRVLVQYSGCRDFVRIYARQKEEEEEEKVFQAPFPRPGRYCRWQDCRTNSSVPPEGVPLRSLQLFVHIPSSLPAPYSSVERATLELRRALTE